jgi:methyl coenzyme M reductase subunit D
MAGFVTSGVENSDYATTGRHLISKMDHRKIGFVDRRWRELAQHGVQLRSLLLAVLKV